MKRKRIGVLSDVISRASDLAAELAQEGYLAEFRHVVSGHPPEPFSPQPHLLIASFSSGAEGSLDLARSLQRWKGVPTIVVSALTLSRLEGPLHALPIVHSVLFEPYSKASLLGVVEDALTPHARELCESSTNPSDSQDRFPNWTGPL